MASQSLQPVSSFIHLRQDRVPPISALVNRYRYSEPSETRVTIHGKQNEKAKTHSGAQYHMYVMPKKAKSVRSHHRVSTIQMRNLLHVHSDAHQLTEPVSPTPSVSSTLLSLRFPSSSLSRPQTSALQHNKELMYNMTSPHTPPIKDVQWQRSLRKSPFVLHAESWQTTDPELKAKTVSAGRLRLFLHSGSEVNDGQAMVSVGYHYCQSCTERRNPILVRLNPKSL